MDYGDCPRCGKDGDVAREARGRASCHTCGGGFVGVAAATANLTSLGLTPPQIRQAVLDKGQRTRGCPTCDRVVATFSLKRELFHACLQCRAVWADAGAWQRVGVAEPATDPAPFSALPAETGLPVPRAAPPDDDAPPAEPGFTPAVGGFSERLSAGGMSALLTIGVGVVLAGLIWFAYGALVQSAEAVALPHGASIKLWDAERKEEPVAITTSLGPLQGTRLSSAKGNTRLEVVSFDVPQIGGLTTNAAWMFAQTTALQLYGKFVKLDEGVHRAEGGLKYFDFVFFTEEGKGTHGTGRVWFDAAHVWVTTAIGEQKAFAQSAVATSFVGSLVKP